jgi:hypothetical protein
VPPYRDFIRDGQDGFLLVNDSALWVEKLLQCADDVSLRQEMLTQHINGRLHEMLKKQQEIN